MYIYHLSEFIERDYFLVLKASLVLVKIGMYLKPVLFDIPFMISLPFMSMRIRIQKNVS